MITYLYLTTIVYKLFTIKTFYILLQKSHSCKNFKSTCVLNIVKSSCINYELPKNEFRADMCLNTPENVWYYHRSPEIFAKENLYKIWIFPFDYKCYILELNRLNSNKTLLLNLKRTEFYAIVKLCFAI